MQPFTMLVALVASYRESLVEIYVTVVTIKISIQGTVL